VPSGQGCDADFTRTDLGARSIAALILPRRNRKFSAPSSMATLCALRNLVERRFSKLKHSDETSRIFRDFILIASAWMWITCFVNRCGMRETKNSAGLNL
jgi:transposase